MNPRFEKAAALSADRIRLAIMIDESPVTLDGAQKLIAKEFMALADAHDLALRCLENLNRNGSVSPQLAAEALAAIKGEA